jgi:hypothetical protein
VGFELCNCYKLAMRGCAQLPNLAIGSPSTVYTSATDATLVRTIHKS